MNASRSLQVGCSSIAHAMFFVVVVLTLLYGEKSLKNLKTCHLGERGSKCKDDLVSSVTRTRASVSCSDMQLYRKPGAENHNQHRGLCP